jgi:transposase
VNENHSKNLELQIVEMNDEAEPIASSDAASVRLRQITGVGPLVTSAIVASIGNEVVLRKGRKFAACLGLLPKQLSTDGRTRFYRSVSAVTVLDWAPESSRCA